MIYIIYHDFRFRTLPVSILVFTLIIVILRSVVINSWYNALFFAAINILILTVQYIFLTIYFSLRNKKLISILNSYIGSGDIWFYGALTFCFSPLNFVLFNALSCFIVIAVYIFQKNKSTIPLAGFLALFLLITVGLNYSFRISMFYQDSFLLSGISYFNNS